MRAPPGDDLHRAEADLLAPLTIVVAGEVEGVAELDIVVDGGFAHAGPYLTNQRHTSMLELIEKRDEAGDFRKRFR